MVKMDYITWLEYRDWSLLKPDDRIVYDGRVWVVVRHVGGARYTVRSDRNRWERLNVNRFDVVRVGTL